MDMLPDKKLKRRLKKLEGLQGGNLQEEKLFEVRIHGLSLYVFFFSFSFPLYSSNVFGEAGAERKQE